MAKAQASRRAPSSLKKDHGEVPGIEGNVTVEYAFVDYGTLIPSDGWKQVGNDWYYVKNYIHQTGWRDFKNEVKQS